MSILTETHKKLMNYLRIKLWFHRYLYYELSETVITDAEYDAIERKLRALELRYSDTLNLMSPTNTVGYNPPRYLGNKILGMVDVYLHPEKYERGIPMKDSVKKESIQSDENTNANVSNVSTGVNTPAHNIFSLYTEYLMRTKI